MVEDLLGPDATGWIRRTLTVSALVAVGGWGALRLVGGAVSGAALAATVLAATVLAIALLHRVLPSRADLARPTLPDVIPASRSDPLHLPGVDSVTTARDPAGLAWWERRLDWLDGDSTAFASKIQPRLVRLIDARLRLRHGVSRHDDPDQARRLLGEALWNLLQRPLATAPTPRDLARIVDAIEQL